MPAGGLGHNHSGTSLSVGKENVTSHEPWQGEDTTSEARD
jgi:hypothetical protein